jgi:hypothetical protein
MMGIDTSISFISDEEAEQLPDFDWVIMPE